jgi:sugar phosphate isomerase/epimerase
MNPIFVQALSFKDVDGTSEQCIQTATNVAVELGIAGVDLEDRLLRSYDPVYLSELRDQIRGRSLEIGYCGLIVDFHAPLSSIDDEVDRATELIEAMPYLGVQYVRVPGNGVVDGQTVEETLQAVENKFNRICEVAKENDITVLLHNHNHGSTPSTGAQVLRLLDSIDSPALKYVLDTGQFQGSPGASGDMPEAAQPQLYESIEMCAPRAVMSRTKFYFADNQAEDWLDYGRIARTLNGVNFDGPLSIVYEPKGTLSSLSAIPLAVEHLNTKFG